LYNTRDPEKAEKPCNKQEHFPFPYITAGKVAFCKYYAYYQEDSKSHQLEKLKA
jgi:hypothetical protein